MLMILTLQEWFPFDQIQLDMSKQTVFSLQFLLVDFAS